MSNECKDTKNLVKIAFSIVYSTFCFSLFFIILCAMGLRVICSGECDLGFGSSFQVYIPHLALLYAGVALNPSIECHVVRRQKEWPNRGERGLKAISLGKPSTYDIPMQSVMYLWYIFSSLLLPSLFVLKEKIKSIEFPYHLPFCY